jgi:hypothetical protein
MTRRKLRGDAGAEPVEGDKATIERPEEMSFLPYHGPDSLPSPDKGEAGRFIYHRRYFVNFDAAQGRRKLIAVFKTEKGVDRRVVRVYKPNNKKAPKDKYFGDMLKKAGIPGA